MLWRRKRDWALLNKGKKSLTARRDYEKESEKARWGGIEGLNGMWEEEERPRKRGSVSD